MILETDNSNRSKLQGQQQTVAPTATCTKTGQMSLEKLGLRSNVMGFSVPEIDAPLCNLIDRGQVDQNALLKTRGSKNSHKAALSPPTSNRGMRPHSRTVLRPSQGIIQSHPQENQLHLVHILTQQNKQSHKG